eukprot:TRINITY_DN1917_c0_g1_i1.p2 TRINITY_DN1917_c0_g1~~TRINITY_DN1917_c0_g1_i1.p2  ORF type:complete len:297 (+),score=82.44 TRINITY_DN1917_c0_g1_i1:1506-2396(+)
MKIFITAGTGKIGSRAALALRRRGHTVTALVRDEAKAKKLVEGEVNVLVGDVLKPETYRDAIRENEAIIDTTSSFTTPNFDLTVYNILLEEIKKAGGNKKRLIFTSGGLAYAGSLEPVTEESPFNPNPFIQGRIQVTKSILANKDVYGTVIVPSMVYGGEGGHYTTFFQQAEQGKVAVYGTGKNVLSNVHIDDIADAYVRVIEANTDVVSGQAFNFAEEKKLTLEEVAQAYADAAGFKGKVETGAPFPFALFDTNMYFDTSKARRVLGWNPSRKDLTQEAPLLFKAWKTLGYPSIF